MYSNTLELCSLLNQDIPIIIGGAHASALPKQTAKDFKDMNFYLLIRGPAEDAIVDILSNTPKQKIPRSVYYNQGGRLVENEVIPIGSFQNYPHVDRSFFINDPLEIGGNMTSFLLSSRGCFYDCSFCSIHTTWDQKTMFREVDDILDEMKNLYSRGVRSFKFLDDLFLINSKRLNEFYQGLGRRDLLGKLDWSANSRVNVINRFSDYDITLLAQSGCGGIGLGLESGNDDLLKTIGKGFTSEESRESVRRLRNAGIKSYGYFIIGFPEEDDSQINNTINFAYRLSNEFGLKAGIVPYKLYPGSRDYKNIIGNNPSNERVHQLIKFKTASLTHPNDPESVKNFLKQRERHTVIHNPEHYNPSNISSDKIVEYIRDFYLRSRFG